MDDANKMTNNIPIILCNTLYKIISKVMVNRQKLVLDKLISQNQRGFVKGRIILNVVITTHDIIHLMEARKKLV